MFEDDAADKNFVSTPDLIWQVAAARPESIAVVWGCRRVSYGELVARAESLAAQLGGSSEYELGRPIAVSTDLGLRMIVGALACWRIGSPYMPLSSSAPAERTLHMLTESGVRIVLADGSLDLPFSGPVERISLQRFCDSPVERLPEIVAAKRVSRQDDHAYIIYTSGSTGAPKGVVVSHRNLTNLIEWHHAEFAVTATDRATQLASLTFDASVLEIWPFLSAGATLLIPDRSVLLQPEALQSFLLKESVTMSFAATAVAEQLMALRWPSDTELRYLLTGADTLARFPALDLPFRVVNNYGPTECTVLATSAVVPAKNEKTTTKEAGVLPSIGRPIRGANVFLLDSELRPVADGQRGEICIAGECVACGYVKRPDLTAERFVQRPDVAKGERFYRTGDLASKLPNGEFQFWGRADEQIKMRGFRIEPAEVVAALSIHPAVRAAAVTVVGQDLARQLAAYVVLKQAATAGELREHLHTLLPDYMVPGCFVQLKELPLTANGKVNRALLPLPDASNSLETVEPAVDPGSEIQFEVLSILSSLLSGRQVGLNDNFFRVGGNSLLAAQVITRLRGAFGVELPLRSVFESPTAGALSASIEKKILAEMEREQAVGQEVDGQLVGAAGPKAN